MIPKEIIIHHSASSADTTLEQINAWHKARGFTVSSLGNYVGYHYVIDKTGKIFQTRRDNEIGCHTIPNEGKIGVCLIGNFQTLFAPKAQITAMLNLVKELKKLYNINEIKGHRDFQNTECPGDNLYLYVLADRITFIQKLINLFKKTFYSHV